MRRRDWALLAIAAGGAEGLTPVQLQKSLFLLGQNCRGDVGADYYVFIPYDYGPFDSEVYADADMLGSEGLVAIEPVAGKRWNRYAITDSGTAAAQRAARSAPDHAVRHLQELVRWAQQLSFAALVNTIYKHFPQYKINSVFNRR
ncbi:MAG: hypothetical protein ACYC5O_00895 [Anaerolineae bacterium]